MATINTDAEIRAYHRLRAAGMTPDGACGLIGNLEAESDGFWPNRVEYLCLRRLMENRKVYTDETYTDAIDSGKISCEEFLHPIPGKQYGYGLAQWTSPGRKAGLWNLAKQKGVSIADEDMQMEYLICELEEKHEGALKVLKTATSIRTASDKVLLDFESPSGITDATKQGRAARGQRFYDNYVKGESNMGATAAKVLDIARSYIGCKESDGSYKKIIDLYNSHKPLARGYALKYTDSWCDGYVSAVAIQAGAVDLIGTECGCEEHVKIFKSKGIWIEDGKITPVPGDIIVYNWDDSTQQNDGYSDHIGYVEQVSGGVITTIEGNYQNSVKNRSIRVGHGNIRGYARPKYASENSEAGGKYMFSVGNVKKGSQGNDVKLLQRLLKSNGCKGKDGKPLKLDGDCGDNTVCAIKAYQKKKGIKVDGIAGENTWKSILLRQGGENEEDYRNTSGRADAVRICHSQCGIILKIYGKGDRE